jgi:transposase
VITDAHGLPLLVHTTPANVRDEQPVLAMVQGLPSIQGPRGRPRHKPKAFAGDRGYGFPWIIAAARAMKITSLLDPRGAAHGSGLGKVRYVVERTMAWFGNWRRLRLCYEKTPAHWQAYNELAACMICFRRFQRLTTVMK